MKTTAAIMLALFAACFCGARAACTPGAPAAYEDIDRLLLVRCQPVTGSYPCFRALFNLDGPRVTSASMNAVMGVGLRGTYELAFAATARTNYSDDYIRWLRDVEFLKMVVPRAQPSIDGEFNLIAIRRCGTVTVIRTDGDIDDGVHSSWSSLLQRLQAVILSSTWRQVSPKYDGPELSKWFRDEALPELLEP
jgi:hypothetical protein